MQIREAESELRALYFWVWHYGHTLNKEQKRALRERAQELYNSLKG